MSNRCQTTSWSDIFCLTWQKDIKEISDRIQRYFDQVPNCQTNVMSNQCHVRQMSNQPLVWHFLLDMTKRYQRNIWQNLEIFWPSSKLSNQCHIKPLQIDWGLCLKFPMKSWIIEIFLCVIWLGDYSSGSPLKLESWKHFFGEYSFSSPWNMNRFC